MGFVRRIQAWYHTKPGLITFGLVKLALAYAFVSWAIDTGSLLDYACAIVLIIGGLQDFKKLITRTNKVTHD